MKLYKRSTYQNIFTKSPQKLIGLDWIDSREHADSSHATIMPVFKHMTVAYGLFEYDYIDEGYDESLSYMDCKLLKDVGDVKAGTEISCISVSVFTNTRLTFSHNGNSYTFYLDAVPVNLSVKKA